MRAVLSSLVFSIVLMIFPVASGIIVTVNNMGEPQSYWVQGAFMLVSTAAPLGVLLITGTQLNRIGFSRMKTGGAKAVLYFIPLILSKTGYLFFGLHHKIGMIVPLIFFTAAIGLSEEIYFRGVILSRLTLCFPIKQAIPLASILFAAVHASQAFSGAGLLVVTLTVVNALIFGIVASEIVILTGSLIPAVIWHALYDFINWIASIQEPSEAILITVQSVIITAYGVYLWRKLPDKQTSPSKA